MCSCPRDDRGLHPEGEKSCHAREWPSAKAHSEPLAQETVLPGSESLGRVRPYLHATREKSLVLRGLASYHYETKAERSAEASRHAFSLSR